MPKPVSAIRVDDVWKRFRLYHERHQTLKETVLSMRRASYEELWGLRGVSIEVQHGKTVGLIGKNGSGKSTLLKIVAKILQADKGTVSANGRISALLELGAGFQPDLTGRENIYLNGSILRLSRKEIDKKFDEIVAFSELEKFIDTPVKNYSSGMYMRLGFSIAVNVEPDILLVDEVLAVGDEAFQRKCFEKIRRFKEGGGSILFVTHETDIVKQICDSAVMLDDGVVVSEGLPADVVKAYHDLMLTVEKGAEGGTKEVVITNVEILDGSGSPAKRFDAGDRMILRIYYKSGQQVNDPVFGFAFFDQRDTRVFGTNTDLRQFDAGTINGEGVAEFDLGVLSMLDGKYTVTVAIHSRDRAKVYHWQERFYAFEIINSFHDEGGVFIPVAFKLIPKRRS
jgi:ABC-type polysaccharide/polyol phosphate transport system ATPase subunit